jgi:DNA-binding LacI/PurR family transcriptional regulator
LVERYQQLAASGFPLIEMFGISIPGVPRVNFDFRGDGRRVIEHLVGLGHRRIAVVLPETYRQKLRHWTVAEFYQGCREALREAHIEVSPIIIPAVASPSDAEAYQEGGRDAAREILASRTGFTAVVCYSVLRTLGLLEELQQNAVAVPQEMSVFAAGYDDFYSRLARPALTGTRLDAQAAGRAAAELIFELLDGKSGKDSLIPGMIEKRKSDSAPRTKPRANNEP